MPSEVWAEITCTVEVLIWIGNFIPHVILDVITYPSIRQNMNIGSVRSYCNIIYPFRPHLQLKSHEVSLEHNSFLSYKVVLLQIVLSAQNFETLWHLMGSGCYGWTSFGGDLCLDEFWRDSLFCDTEPPGGLAECVDSVLMNTSEKCWWGIPRLVSI